MELGQKKHQNGDSSIMRCVHCGRILDGRYHLCPWLSSCDKPAYEHWDGTGPACDAGIEWYDANTIRTIAGRMLLNEREGAVREQRLALCRS